MERDWEFFGGLALTLVLAMGLMLMAVPV